VFLGQKPAKTPPRRARKGRFRLFCCQVRRFTPGWHSAPKSPATLPVAQAMSPVRPVQLVQHVRPVFPTIKRQITPHNLATMCWHYICHIRFTGTKRPQSDTNIFS
jgi:hypothetical protein